MKKLTSLLLALTLVFCLCGTALAADDVSLEDVTIELPEIELPSFETRDISPYAAGTSDEVKVNGNRYTVRTGDLTFILNLDSSLGIVCLTQDFVASASNYLMFSDPQAIWELLLENEMHFYFLNMFSQSCAFILTPGSDTLSEKFGDLSSIPEAIQQAVAAILAQSFEFDEYEIVTLDNGMTWVRLANLYVTFVGGQYVFTIWQGDADTGMTENDLLDMEDLLSCLTIKAD